MQKRSQAGGSFIPTLICYSCWIASDFCQQSCFPQLTTGSNSTTLWRLPHSWVCRLYPVNHASWRQTIFFLKALLNTFAESTGLRVNYRKSQMLPINVLAEKMEILSQTFGCSIGTLPFTYLGLPMGTTKPMMENLTPMMDRVESCLLDVAPGYHI